MSPALKMTGRILLVILVLAIAAGLHYRTVTMLPVDYDEDDYLRAGQQYADRIRQGDWSVFTRTNYRTEHPPLMKIIYGLSLLSVPAFPEIRDLPTTASPNQALPAQPLRAGRTASAVLGVLEVLALAVFNPLAGLFLAVQTYDLKYTSQVMLESLPALTSLLLVLFYLRWQKTSRTRWLVLSAIMLGFTAAGKYYYGLTGFAVVLHWLWTNSKERHTTQDWMKRLRLVILWGLLGIVVFFVCDPYLWPDPINRLTQSLVYHVGYAQSEAVKAAGFPWYQIFFWLSKPVPWHPGVFLVQIEPFILLFAVLGIKRAYDRHLVFLIWLVLGLGFLLVWPTKWPQYSLLVLAPLCVLAADGFQAFIIDPVARLFKKKQASSPVADQL
jgi:hypothetical protein